MRNTFAAKAIGILICALCITAGQWCASSALAGERPNVLLIAVDDLRPDLGCYGSEVAKTPHIDRFAETALLFERAYCQQAVCNPSRTSLMTGMRPDAIGITGNHRHFRDRHPHVVTLPQHFKRHGYHAQSIGKIYHGLFPDGTSKTVWDTMGDAESWSVPTTRFGPRYYFTEEGIRQAKQAFAAMYRPTNPGPDDWTQKLVFGPMTEAPDVPDNTLYDGKVADAAVTTLKELAEDPDQPFFLAVGFIKPHTPFVAPKMYWDMYDLEEIQPAATPFFPASAPRIGGHGSGEIRRYTDQPNQGEIPAANAQRMRHGYLACVSYIDAQIGRVLSELERLKLSENTIVVLFSDHGYHLGEHGLWGKMTNFELDTRVPLIVRSPGMKSAGKSTPNLTELIDIYPTLAELSELPLPSSLQGKSLAPLLDQPDAPWKVAAFSQFPRGGNANTGGAVMGYSMRTKDWRYTEWIDNKTGRAVAKELYDHRAEKPETVNVAEEPEHRQLVAQLSGQLRAAVLPKEISDKQAEESKLTKLQDPQPVAVEPTILLQGGKPRQKLHAGWEQQDGFIEGQGKAGLPIMPQGLAEGDFRIAIRLKMIDQKGSAASFYLDNNHFGFEGGADTVYLNGPIFGGKVTLLAPSTDVFERGAWIDFEAVRNGTKVFFRINGKTIHTTDDGGRTYDRVGLSPWRSTMRVSDISVAGKLKETAQSQPFVDVFVQGREYPSFRIPSIVVSKEGILLAFAEGRNKRSDHAANDIVLKRSTDGGKSWGKLILVAADGENSLNNPQAVVVPETGRILMMYQRYPEGIHEGQVQPGHDGPKICRNFLTHSDNDGQTWSKPRDITATTKRKDVVTSIAGGPGIGIVLQRGEHAGRIIMPFNQGPFGKWKVYAVYSDDGGENWKYGEVAPDGETQGVGNEVQMVELSDGSLMLNSRTQGGNRVRKVAISRDGGQSWSPLRDDPQLPEPQCQGTILRYDWPQGENPGRLVFANPATKSGRTRGTIKASTDDGKTWSKGKLVYPGGFAYSCLTKLPGGDVGLLFERDGYQAVSFMRIPMITLSAENDTAVQTLDLDSHDHRQAIVDKEKGQYLGHPTTCLLEDGKTMLCVYPKGHGRGGIVYKRSSDGGKTWSDRLPTPESWATSKEVPTLHRVVDAEGQKRIIMWSGLYPARLAVTEDDGKAWSELKPVGDWGGIVVMGFVEALNTGKGHYLAMFHDDGRFFTAQGKLRNPRTMTLYKTFSTDGGLTWSFPEEVYKSSNVHLCEPGCIRSPDGKQMAVLLRENSRRKNSHIIFSSDEGKTWSAPRQVPLSLTGDRHTGKYAPDGRLFISFRCRSPKRSEDDRPFSGDWVAWVGTWDDLVAGRTGQYFVRLKDNTKGADCAYPGVELLPDGTIVTTTYGHWDEGESPYILSVRLRLNELDELAKKQASKEQIGRPNVLLITSEDNGPELGCYGDAFARTPNLDRLADDGVRFTTAQVPYSVCSPSRAVIFTGLYPHQNGQVGLATHKFAMYRKWPNMVSLLKQNGYRTGIIGKIHVNPESAFPCDFRAFPGSNFNDRPMEKFADAAGKFIREGDAPFFLMVNFPDAHFPLIRQQHGLPKQPLGPSDVKPLRWIGADSPRLREFTANYYNCLSRLDSGVGMLLDRLEASGRADNTLVIYLGDHGAQFSRGKTSVYEAGLNIPLIIRAPGCKPGTTCDELVSTVDLLPTILQTCGIDYASTTEQTTELPGRSLVPLLRGEAPPWREHLFAMTTGSAPALYFPQFSVRDARYKLIISPLLDRKNTCAQAYLDRFNTHFAAGTSAEEIADSSARVRAVYDTYLNPPAVELYDLTADPYEFVNLAESKQHAGIRERLLKTLRNWRTAHRDPLADSDVLSRFTAEHDGAPRRNYRRDKSFRWQYPDYFSAALAN